jgi:hypothetical protein
MSDTMEARMTTRKETHSQQLPAGGGALRALAKSRLTDKSVGRLKEVGGALAAAKDKKVSGRISGELLATVKQRLGVTSDTEAIEMALVNMAITDDFGTWLVDQAGQLDQDFELEL